jgi:tetratricopeptide (TPR) repeat protein
MSCGPWGGGVEAAGAYAEAVRLQPDLAVAHANLGLVLLQAGKSDAAVAHFQKAVELSPDDPAAHQQLAEAHVSADDWAAAIPCCECCVALRPEDADALSRLGLAYQNDDRHAEAETAYLRALELQPDHLDARLNLGSLHEELGRMAEAEACFLEAEACQPHASSSLVRRALLLRSQLPDSDRDRLRFELYERQEAGLRSSLLFALAQVADSRGDYAEAAACLEPANSLARELRRGRGETYDSDEHSRLVDKIIAAFPTEVFRRLADADARRPVAACGLEWEPACLRFHETVRPVRTASVAQVRQPLYRKSLGRWRS